MRQELKARPVVLCILDGWGHREDPADNAIRQAATPCLDRLMAERPWSLIDASELAVGLPSGQMGNSEVGHMNLGAGRVVMQDLPRIDQAVAEKAIPEIESYKAFVTAVKGGTGRVHLMGLLSTGGVHAHQDHIAALAEQLRADGLEVLVHAFLDGRDTPPKSALGYLADFAEKTGAEIATVSGRYYAMDRDKRWDRVELAYDCLMDGKGAVADSAVAAVEAAYARGESDEFVQPTALAGYKCMQDGDGLLMANFRADRAREILTVLLDPAFDGFARTRRVAFSRALGMVEYAAELNRFLPALFPPPSLSGTLGEVIASAGLSQLRIAETEKYAHVTFFFNGGEEEPYPGEERILVPSPKVKTYDLQPEMAAPEVTDKLVAAIESGRFDLIVVNYANGDMVGHTGFLDAAVQAAETVDRCLAWLTQAVAAAGGALLITADHGNAEMMQDPATGQPHTAHTMNPVPALLAVGPAEVTAMAPGRLADVAPTLLSLLGLPQPGAMTGQSLLRPAGSVTQSAAAE